MTTVEQVTVEAVARPLTEPFEISLGVRESARNVLVTETTFDPEIHLTGPGNGITPDR